MSQHLQAESLNQLLRDLALALKQLTHETTKLEDLDRTLTLSREIHERIAILRYKAIEDAKNVPIDHPAPAQKGAPVVEDNGTPEAQPEPQPKSFAAPFTFSVRQPTPQPSAPPPTEAPAKPTEPAAPVERVKTVPTPATAREDEVLSLADRHRLAPLDQLSSAMGINDRVRFATELFDSDMTAFNAACKTLEASENLESALNILRQQAESTVDWDAEQGAARDFQTLVERLFVD